MKRLIIHIGMAKTATTALQGFLFDNRGALADHHILFPKTMALRTAGHYHFAHALIGTPRAKTVRGTLPQLIAEIESAEHDVILSAETLSSYSPRHPVPERLAEFAHSIGRRATILVYLRDQAGFAESLYAQRVITGLTIESFEDFVAKCLENPLFDYAGLLARWSDGFDDIVVRRFPPRGGIAVEDDFLAAAGTGIDADELPRPLIRRNERISARAVEYLRSFSVILRENQAPPSRRDRLLRRMRDSMARSKESSGAFRALTPEIVEKIESRFAQGNAEVARRFLGEEALFPARGEDALEPVNMFAMDAEERKRLRATIARIKRADKRAETDKEQNAQ